MTTFKSIAPMKLVQRIERTLKFVEQGDSNRFRY